MCGLVGIIAKNQSGFFSKDADIFKQLLYADAMRGWDATGVFGVTKEGNVDIKKQAVASGHFLQTTQYEEFNRKIISNYHIAIGHNRKATHGKKRHEDAHPFWDKEEKICLVHNGMIRNYKTFCKEATVDSAAIVTALSTRPREEVLAEVEGAFAFIWYDVEEKALFFIKNSERPLHIIETNTTYILSSEQALGFWIAGRNNETIKNTVTVEDMHLYKYDLATRTIKDEQTIVKKTSPITNSTVVTVGMVTTAYTTPTKTATEISVYESYDLLFLNDTDLKTPQNVLDNISTGSVIGVNISSYTEKKNHVQLDCTLINTTRDWIQIQTFMGKAQFEELDLTSPHILLVNSIRRTSDKIIIFGSNLTRTDAYTTLNDVIVTEDMWFHNTMPCECSICNQKVFWAEIAKSSLIVSNMEVDVLVCPECSSYERVVNE